MSTEQEKTTEAVSLESNKSEQSSDEVDSDYYYRVHKASDPIPIGYNDFLDNHIVGLNTYFIGVHILLVDMKQCIWRNV